MDPANPPDTLGGGGVSSARVYRYWSLDGTLLGRPGPALNTNGNPGVFAAGKLGQCMHADGSSAALAVLQDVSELLPMNDVWATAFWFRQGVSKCAINMQDSSGNHMYCWVGYANPNQIWLYISEDGTAGLSLNRPTSPETSDGAWHHLCASWNRITGTINLWIDGVRTTAVRASTNGAHHENATQFTMAINGGTSADGSIDEVYYFLGEPTAAQVAALVAGYVPP